MITRPLDLASRLRPEPRNFDWMFFVNVAVIGVFFAVFGSRFVLAPGLAVNFRLPVVAGARSQAKAPTQVITVTQGGKIFTPDGLRDLRELGSWLREQVKGSGEPVLLVRTDFGVTLTLLTEIASAAKKAGFTTTVLAADEPEVAAAKVTR